MILYAMVTSEEFGRFLLDIGEIAPFLVDLAKGRAIARRRRRPEVRSGREPGLACMQPFQ